jgi:hypothetical protein
MPDTTAAPSATTAGAHVQAQSQPAGRPSPERFFQVPALADGEFEIALVLGGTVSVGTFTAGVLDFLFEALDAWSDIRKSEENVTPDTWTVPHHKVRIRILTGTSGGGVCSLLTARSLHYDFPPARDGQTIAKLNANPFYSVWVNDTDISQFLDDTDLQQPDKPIAALLNGRILETIADSALHYPSPDQSQQGPVTLRTTARDWVNNPLPLVLTQTHLTGVPYQVRFRGVADSVEYFTNHADYVRFYANYPGPALPPNLGPFLPDSLVLAFPNAQTSTTGLVTGQTTPTPWPDVSQYALGTAAFPLGLPARAIARNAADYDYRFVLDTISGEYEWLMPDYAKLLPFGVTAANYSFTALDGGCTDNEPLGLARQVLEGLQGSPANDSVNTRRAIILVDPFCEIPVNASATANMALTAMLGPTVHMFVQSNRFATTDLVNFLHPQVYNRYLIAPKRADPANAANTLTGGDALCGDALAGFLGFASPTFRHTDFMLGRRNCQAFLKWVLTLDRTNKSFLNLGPHPRVPALGGQVKVPQNEVPLIPLVGNLATDLPEPPWPAPGAFDIDNVKDAVQARLKLFFERAEGFLHMNFLGKVAFKEVTEHFLIPGAYQRIVDIVQAELKRKNL